MNNNNSAILAHGWWGQQINGRLHTQDALHSFSINSLTMHFLAQTKDEPNMDWIEDS
jgi:hypothetical protein